MEEITTREIRGITTKFLGWLFGSVISIIVTIVWSYANLTFQLKANNDRVINSDSKIEINNAKIEMLKRDMQLFDIRLTRIEENIKDKVFYKNAN